MDERLFHLIYAAQAGALTSVAAAFSVLGAGWVMLALVPLLALRRYRAPAAALTAVLAVTAVAVSLLKVIVRRVRPCHALAGVSCLWGDTPTDFSFPSGHAAGSFAFAAFAAWVALAGASRAKPRLLRFLVAAIVIMGAACIALSRVYLGVHFPGDVAGGAMLGATIGAAGGKWHVRNVRRLGSGGGEG